MSGSDSPDLDFEALFDGIREVVIVHDHDGEILAANEYACDQLGYAKADLVGEPVSRLLGAGAESAFSERIRTALEAGSATFESAHVREGGDTVPIEVVATDLSTDGEDLVVSVARDISDRKRQEREREALKERYESLFEENPLVIWEEDLSATKARLDEIHARVDSTEQYLRDNPGVLADLLETVEIIGVNQTAVDYYEADSKAELLANFEELFIEPAYDIMISEFAAIARGQTRYRAETASRTLTGDRQEELIELYVPEAAREDYSRVFVTTIDISERKARERELEAVNERLDLALEAGQFGVWDWNIHTGEVTFDQRWAAMLGLSLAEIEPELAAWQRRVHPEDLPAVEAALEAHLDGETDIYESEHRMQTADGEWIWVRDVGRVVEREAGEPVRAVGIHADITDRKEQKRALEEKNERLDEFAHVLSHDLRNPLNVARGRAQLLAEETDSQHAAPLLDALDRMDGIVDDTLLLAREDETAVATEPLDMSELLEQCWEMVETGDATLQVETAFRIRGDRDRLKRVFENLFRNAVEHGGAGVTVRAGPLGDTGFYVEDDGGGIPEEIRSAVFEPGYSATDGTGFGLAIVTRIVQAHGWSVSVGESRDGGARFEFTDVTILP